MFTHANVMQWSDVTQSGLRSTLKKALAGEGDAVLDEGNLKRVSVGACNAIGCVVGTPIEQRRSVLREIGWRETGFSERAQD